MGETIPPEPPLQPNHSVFVTGVLECNCENPNMQWPSTPNGLYENFVYFDEWPDHIRYQDNSGVWSMLLIIQVSTGYFFVDLRIPSYPGWLQQKCFSSDPGYAPSPLDNTLIMENCCTIYQSGYAGFATVIWI